MGGDKHGTKSGHYVDGFLQLFDWNVKSRKKLFLSRSDLPEQSKQGKKYEGNLPMIRLHEEEDEEFGYGAKAPGVVARLMGLDSLPTVSVLEPLPSPFSDTHSLQDAPYRGRNREFYRDRQVMHSSHHFDKVESRSMTATVSRPTRTMPNRPIEKFQSEILPQKPAKTIPITHHKLLSPIKSPIFVPSHDAAHIMEVASKIIEQGPCRSKISSIRSSSVPFKAQEMREQLVTAQRPVNAVEPLHRQVESNAAKNVRGQSMNKCWNGGTVDSSTTAKDSKGKSISLAIQAKVNVQKREGLTYSSRRLASEQDDTKSTQLSRNQESSSKSSNRKSLSQTTSVLRQNNQKQNCPSYRDKPSSKTSVASLTGQKTDTSLNRASSRKSGLQARDDDKRTPYSGPGDIPRKKRSIDGSLNNNKNQITDNISVSEHENPSQARMVANKQYNWIEENRRKGMDVVSFTFSAPITRSLPISEQLRRECERRIDPLSDNRSKTLTNSEIKKLSSLGFNGLKGDALSILLEQKLKELASNLGSPNSFVKTGTCSESDKGNEVSPDSIDSIIGRAREKAAQQEFRVKGINSQMYSGLTGEHQSIRRMFNNFQAGEVDEDHSVNTETKQWDCHLPSPVSILEPLMLSNGCYSSESLASSNREEIKQCSSSVPAQEVGEINTDTFDSASSTSSQIHTTKDSMKKDSWEQGYVNNILCNVELMFKDYVTGRTRKIINPHLFDQLERRTLTEVNSSKLERKVIFDCVGECVDLKCQGLIGGGFNIWMKGIATLKRKMRLSEEVCKEIEGWRRLGNCMVDELVEKDMSSKYGKWLDCEVNEFMLGGEIQEEILDSLVDQVIFELLPSNLLS